MTQYPFPENRVTKTLLGLMMFLLLYLARDTLVTSSILGFYQAQARMLGVLVIAGGIFLWWNRRNLPAVFRDRRIGMLLLTAVGLLLPMIVKRDWQLMYFSVLICVCAAVFLDFFLPCKDWAKYYVVILSVLGIYSILTTYFLRRLPDRELLPIPVFQNQSGVDFYNFLLSFVSLSFVKRRNFGIFREPGVYQFFLMLGLFLNHYWVECKKPRGMWVVSAILTLTMLSTFATGGVVELALFWIVVFFDKKLYRSKWVWVVLPGLLIVGAGVVAYCISVENGFFWAAYDMIIGKFTYQEESVGDRVGSVLVNLNAFLHNPLFGQKMSQVLYAIQNNTTSTLILFAVFGLFGGCLHVAGWVALSWRKEQKLWVNLMLLLILFMSFNTQNLIADVFFWLFPIMALTERLGPCLKKPERKG